MSTNTDARSLPTPTEEPSNANLTNDATDDDSSEEFRYPGADDSSEEFVYPGAEEDDIESPAAELASVVELPSGPAPAESQRPSPAQLESLYAAASSGDLSLLKKVFNTAIESGADQFSLANDASSRTGFNALHAAASRGYLEIVTWLIEECGAIPDLEDKEGETALHKASLNGYISIVQYLLPDRADVHAQDADGWTALHNACAKGYLDIVRWLCEVGGASEETNGQRGVDIQSNGGWTPLMNAASKGNLPVVQYLLNKQSANPLVRNNWGETAYDAAAAVFEVWICELLQRFEAQCWRNTTVPYDPLKVHTTIPLLLHENQRLDTRLKTLAVNGGRPKFSASGLGRQGRRPPFELRLLTPDLAGAKEIPAWRSDVQLPFKEQPFELPMPGPGEQGVERSHFWLSDWTLDVTHPNVDAEDGWQYARQFTDTDDQWTADVSPQLERILTGNVVSNGIGSSSGRASTPLSPASTRSAQSWVRRRRWVRVMRRRLDIPPTPFLQPDGKFYLLEGPNQLVPFTQNGQEDDHAGGEGQELTTLPQSFLSSQYDYVGRARYLVGTPNPEDELDSMEMRRAIAKLERATMELREGVAADEDSERKTQAEVLLNAYTRDLERRRQSAVAQGLTISGPDDSFNEEDDDDESFHYPGADRPVSRASNTTDYFGSRPSSSRTTTDLTPHLAQSDFRVPTNEVPQKVFTGRRAPTPHQMHAQWERDEAVSQCRDCQRRFNFLTRRHHCRKCGRIYCDRCSSYRALLDPSDIIQDPTFAEPPTSSTSRVCQSCFEEINATVPGRLRHMGSTSLERVIVDQQRLMIPGHVGREASSQLSDLAECPVCNQGLDQVGNSAEQEIHVKNCLEGGSGSTPQSAKYLVYRLPAESTLVGVECVICLEEFVNGSTVARLSCFCSFHNQCLSSWLQRGKSCPVHAR